ncbi:MAG: GAF domain-containing protein [Desulfobacula sp.]|nr:GAF domain-containing protein [Desulfobacula sp.]
MNITKEKRQIGRRTEDFTVREQNERFHKLCEVGKTITAEIDINVLFPLVMNQTNHIMGTQRSSVFLYDEKTDELWSLVATGMENCEIRISAKVGIGGWVFKHKESLSLNEAYKDPRFNVGVDCKTGFKTENILCVPLINSGGHCIGVLQALNKKKGKFTDVDTTFLSAISDYVAIALENARLYDDVKNYSKNLQEQVIINESLTKLKNQLTKFVPHSVASIAEKDPDRLSVEKHPMDVSVLFVDIQNFSVITENYDQRMVNHMVENHFSSYLKCIHQHGGEINETSGDGIMVIFKSDTIENYAFEAVLTALDIIEENKRINREFNYPWGQVDLHIGISSGEGYVGITRMKSSVMERWTYTASGLVTILAARIGALSKKSKLYVGPKTYNMVREQVECEFLGNRTLKNVSKKIPIYRVTGIIPPPDKKECSFDDMTGSLDQESDLSKNR